jgi:glycosyltransferase involved in cell wall biosynthesis
MSKFISIIIPCYNEAENIKRGVLTQVDNYLQKQDFSWEVIIADDESTDNSWELVEDFIKEKSNYIHLKNKHGGKPFAVRSGLEKARGEWVLLTDMDQATPIDQLDKLLPYFKQGDVVIGSRGMNRKNFPLYRKIASIIFLTFRRLLLLHQITDTQCGFKAFKKEVISKIFPRLEVFKTVSHFSGWRVSAYDVELLFLAEKSGYKIIEVPVKWEDLDISKGKKRSFIKESMEMAKEIIRVRLNDWRQLYD